MRQDQFFAEVDRAFGIRAHGRFEPNTDVYIDEARGRLVVHVELAGSDGDELRIAVDENYRGKGLGAGLVRSANAWFLKQGYFVAQVVTQGRNLAACKLYENCGYSLEKIENYYHFWL